PMTSVSYIDTLSLHDALPILGCEDRSPLCGIFRSILPWLVRLREATDFLSLFGQRCKSLPCLFLLSHELAKVCSLLFLAHVSPRDRKSTRLNSSHVAISYAVF